MRLPVVPKEKKKKKKNIFRTFLGYDMVWYGMWQKTLNLKNISLKNSLPVVIKKKKKKKIKHLQSKKHERVKKKKKKKGRKDKERRKKRDIGDNRVVTDYSKPNNHVLLSYRT